MSDAGRIVICSGEIPTGILKFEGELTPEQLAMFRALWEAAADMAEPEGFRVWKAGVAHGHAAERERIRQLAIDADAWYMGETASGPDYGVVEIEKPFADLIGETQ